MDSFQLLGALRRHIPWSGEQAVDERVLLVFPMQDKDVLCNSENKDGGIRATWPTRQNSLESDVTALNSIASLVQTARLRASDCVTDNVRRAGWLMNLQPLITSTHRRRAAHMNTSPAVTHTSHLQPSPIILKPTVEIAGRLSTVHRIIYLHLSCTICNIFARRLW